MSLAGFAFLIAFIGAVVIFGLVVGLMVYAARRGGLGVSADETYRILDTTKGKWYYKLLIRVGRTAFGLFWGGLIVGIVAAIVGA